LFNLDGHVIGIHSRIGKDEWVNLHVPVNEFRVNWDRLVAKEQWGELPGQARSYIGVQGDKEAGDARITKVLRNSPAMNGGIRVGDVIVRFGGNRVTTFESLSKLVRRRQPGDRVTVEVLRGSEIERLKLTVGKDRVEPQ
jgi:serine protease Do